MLVTREMKAKDFEGHALDILDRMSEAERKRVAMFLKLYGLGAGSDVAAVLNGLAKTVARA